MRLVRDILSLALAASALTGMQILLTDNWLWLAAPSHAYGLIAFVTIDILLTIAVLEKVHASILAAALASTVQMGVMLGDLFMGQPTSIPSAAFRAYLINDASYSALIVIQSVILIIAFASKTKPLLERHIHTITRHLSRGL